jgi:hypothetical protein
MMRKRNSSMESLVESLILCAVLGIVFFMLGIFCAFTTRRYLRRALSAAGTVISVRERQDSEPITTYRTPTIQYAPSEGTVQAFEGPAYSDSKGKIAVGDHVLVLYHRKPPHDPFAPSFSSLYAPTLVSFWVAGFWLSVSPALVINAVSPLGPPVVWTVIFLFGLPFVSARFERYLSQRKTELSIAQSPPPVSCHPLVEGRFAIITYSGWLADCSSSLTLHWGYNGWNHIVDTRMTNQHKGMWQATIMVPSGASIVNMTFFNQNAVWDNKGSANYNLKVIVKYPYPARATWFRW